jgi:hypothetical protein
LEAFAETFEEAFADANASKAEAAEARRAEARRTEAADAAWESARRRKRRPQLLAQGERGVEGKDAMEGEVYHLCPEVRGSSKKINKNG